MRIFCPAMVFLSLCTTAANRSVLGGAQGAAAGASPRPPTLLLQDLGDATCTYRATTLADGETQALFHGDRLDQLNRHLGVVARHDHLGALGQVDDAGDVSGAEVELRAVVIEERGVPAAFVLRQDVDVGLELGVRRDRAGLAHDLTALHVFTLGATKQHTHVVARTTFVEQLAEHLDAGDRGARGLLGDADDLDGLADLDDATLDTTGHDSAAAGDREHALDRHQERLLDLTNRLGHVAVARGQQFEDRLAPLGVALERLQRRHANHGDVVTGELVLAQQLADFELDELEDFFVVDNVGLVEGNDDVCLLYTSPS